VLGGRLTDAFGPRWVWGAAALLSGVSAVVGFTLARGVAKASPQAAELPETAVEPEPAVEAHSRTG